MEHYDTQDEAGPGEGARRNPLETPARGIQKVAESFRVGSWVHVPNDSIPGTQSPYIGSTLAPKHYTLNPKP